MSEYCDSDDFALLGAFRSTGGMIHESYSALLIQSRDNWTGGRPDRTDLPHTRSTFRVAAGLIPAAEERGHDTWIGSPQRVGPNGFDRVDRDGREANRP